MLDLEVPRQGEISIAMYWRENVVISSQNKDGRVELENTLDNVNTNKMGSILGNQVTVNKFDDHDKNSENISKLTRRNLLEEFDAQKKRISDIVCKRKQKDELMIEIDTKNKEIIEGKKEKKSLKTIYSTKIHLKDPFVC